MGFQVAMLSYRGFGMDRNCPGSFDCNLTLPLYLLTKLLDIVCQTKVVSESQQKHDQIPADNRNPTVVAIELQVACCAGDYPPSSHRPILSPFRPVDKSIRRFINFSRPIGDNTRERAYRALVPALRPADVEQKWYRV